MSTDVNNHLLMSFFITVMELNDKLIKLNEFYCLTRLEFLNLSIMLHNSENICGRCYGKSSFKNTIRNVSLEVVVKQLIVPCRNK